MASKTFVIGFAALCLHGATAGDPYLAGFQGRKSDFTGQDDGAWYSVISDISDISDRPSSTHVNVRLTSPAPELLPEIAYITGLSVITADTDGSLDHSIVIRVTNPHSLESSCPVGMSPCLADGALTVEIDGEETLLAPGAVEVGSGVAVSTVNLPAPCRSFGFESHNQEAEREDYAVSAGRKLDSSAVVTGLQDMAYWILGDTGAASLVECAEYVAAATAGAEDGLFAHGSGHASFQIVTPGALIRLSHGKLHQLPMRDPAERFDLRGPRTWQMNLALEHNGLSPDASGILGDSNGKQRVVQGMQSVRGRQEDYRVEGPLEISFVAQGKDKPVDDLASSDRHDRAPGQQDRYMFSPHDDETDGIDPRRK